MAEQMQAWPMRRKGGSNMNNLELFFANSGNMSIFALRYDACRLSISLCHQSDMQRIFWSDGRVARQRSAKPCTAVRIRFRPHKNRVVATYNAVLFLVCTVFVRQVLIRSSIQ